MKKIFTLVLFLTSIFAFAQDDSLVGSLETLGTRGQIVVWADGSSLIRINMPEQNGFSLNRNEVSEFLDHLNQFDKFVAKAAENKINFNDTLLNTACATVAPSGAKVYLFASSDKDGKAYLGVELSNPYVNNKFGQTTVFWLEASVAQKFKSLLMDAVGEDSNIAQKIKAMHEAARGQ